jgi:L-lactate dehydrogenase (cytochrome)
MADASSTISMLPKIADAIGHKLDVMFDGGIRSGQDLMRAFALGAKSCLIGRAYVYGLGAGGQAGVSKAIEIIGKELDVTMALTGVTRIADVGRDVIASETAPAQTQVLRAAARRKPAVKRRR